jgi:hypothetical protein
MLPLVEKHRLKALLGRILLVAAACLMLPGFFERLAGGGQQPAPAQ